MTNANGADTNMTTNGNADKLKSIARDINTILTQSGVRGESPIEPDGTSKTS